jgi:ABC-type lipoprotein export system ATPase subunit/ABC-type lipoprotein release transport system permease subunit
MIEVNNLNFSYPSSTKNVLEDISISFPDTGLFYLVGESGSGKSTFVHILSGLIPDYKGNVEVNNQSLSSLSEKQICNYLRTTCSTSFQFDELYKDRTVKDNLLISLEISVINDIEKNNRIINVASKLNISHLLYKKVELLSGGEIKRVSLARSLIKDFSILLLDEPLGPLDKNNRKRLADYFVNISKHSLVIIVSHNQKEIPVQASILEMNEGNIRIVRSKCDFNNKLSSNTCRHNRCRPNTIRSFINGIKLLMQRKKQSYFSIFATTLSLVTIGLIILISTSISSSLKSYFDGAIDANAILVQPRRETISEEDYSSTSYMQVQTIQKEYADYIYGIGAHYQINFENLFTNKNEVYFNNSGKKYNLSKLSARSFEEFTYYRELDSEFDYLSSVDLSNDDVVMGLPYEEIDFLCQELSICGFNKLEDLNDYFTENSIYIHLDLACSEIGYELESLFNVYEIVETDIPRIIHTNPLFSEYFVEENMRFQGDGEVKSEYDAPWIVHKVYFLYFDETYKRKILNQIEIDKEFSSILFKNMNGEYKMLNGVFNLSNNRVELYDNYQTTILLSDINEIVLNHSTNISTLLISDGFYYYSNEGMISGFLHPIFASSKKEKLNKIADYNYAADYDLHGFQGSSIVFDEGVVMGDLSNTQENPLTFKAYINSPSLLKGYIPADENQIIISSNLAQELFQSTNVISSFLYLSCLTSTEYISGGYKNIFVDGKLMITGIVESDENAIYQSPRFLRNLGEDQFNLSIEDRSVDKVIITFNHGYNSEDLLGNLNQEYYNYEFSLPSEAIEKGIDEIIFYVDIGLGIFGTLSGIIASVLMTEVLILFIKKDRNKIRMLLCLGWSKADLMSQYWIIGFTIGAISYLSSLLSIILCEKILTKTINLTINIELNISNLQISLINLIFLIISVAISCLFSGNKVHNRHLFE